MRVSAYVLVAFSGLLLTASIITIVLLLDDGAQRAINKVIDNLQEKTLALSVESVSREVLKIIPILSQTVHEYKTGFGDPPTMTMTELKYYFEQSARILMQKIAPYLYYSQITLPYTWQDSNCYWDGDAIGCLRPVPNGNFAYEERYTSGFPINISEAAKRPSFTANLSGEYYEQRIASLTNASVSGSWSSPYYFFDEVTQTPYALQTLSIPLEFNAAGTCVKATSADVSLEKVGSMLRAARASDVSVLFIVDPVVGKIVSSSDASITLWDVSAVTKDNPKPALWDINKFPSEIVGKAVNALFSRMPETTRVNADSKYFTNFEMTFGDKPYLVASMHMRHKDLLWIMVDVTPRSFYYKTLDEARVVSVSIGSVIGFVALVVTVACFVILISNLNSLGDEMDKLATMDVDSDPIPSNAISEINRMVVIFNLVVKNLRLFKSLMPSSAFDEGADDEDDEEKEDEKEKETAEEAPPGAASVEESGPINIKQKEPGMASRVSGQSQTSKIHAAKGNLKDAFALRLETKAATVAEIRIAGFESMCNSHESDVVIAIHGDHINTCNELLKESKGILGNVVADRLTFHWNVQNKISGAPPKAAKACVALSKDPRAESALIALHMCKVRAGYMGTETIRGYQLVGTHQDLINRMFLRMEKNCVRIQCSPQFRNDVWTAFDVREVDEIDDIRLFEIIDAAKQGADEWMYQLEGNDAKTGKYAAFHNGWTSWREGKHAEAISVMEAFCIKNEGDAVAKALAIRWAAEVKTT